MAYLIINGKGFPMRPRAARERAGLSQASIGKINGGMPHKLGHALV